MKLHFSWLWIPFVIIMGKGGMLKTMLFLCVMLSLHELAHICMAYRFHYPVEKVIVYPFGLCAQMKYIGLGNVWKELLIVMAGPFMHMLFPFAFQWFQHIGWISQPYAAYLTMLNTSILVFNLLPIYPLDGGRIMQSLLHLVFRFTWAQRLTMMLSVLNIVLLMYYHILTTWSAWLVMVFLLLQVAAAWKQIGLQKLQFYHYRKHHPVSLPLRYNAHQDLYRGWCNMLECEQGWIMEEDWLNYYFHDNAPLLTYTSIL